MIDIKRIHPKDVRTCNVQPEDHALYRVFDSLTFENEENNKWESGMNMGGEFSDGQTKDMGFLVSN